LEFSPDGRTLVTACRDGTFRLWEAGTGKPLSPPRHQGVSCNAVRFAPDGRTFVVWDTTGFRYWDTVRVEPVSVHFPAPGLARGTADCASFNDILSPDGTRVFMGMGMAHASIWTVSVPRGPVPAWFPSLLETLALTEEDAQGANQLVSSSRIFGIKEEIEKAPVGDEYAAWARRVLGMEKEEK
jgi:eukaryotic-like serine/threonine-protein kinase